MIAGGRADIWQKLGQRFQACGPSILSVGVLFIYFFRLQQNINIHKVELSAHMYKILYAAACPYFE